MARIGDRFSDQIAATGHRDRPEDLDAVAALGICTLRYPALWEAIAPEEGREDWAWLDARMDRMRSLGIAPILGLVHHGAGPRATSLVDPAFPEGLARHAAQVAARYPWVQDFTPVNEPLTTARFAGLYGHWHPHGRDDRTFLRALATECLATAAAMRAIRRVTPGARLVQTEDLGRVLSTRPLADQAEHDEARRWLSLDLLTGRVDRGHRFFDALLDAGVPERDLLGLADAPCPPDIVGVNHYLTSDRYLDHRTDLYPPETRGGNGRQVYADVAAVRVDLPAGEIGPEAVLRDAWERYGLPLAITEVHNGCTREEQLRWVDEVWRAAHAARAGGADVRAVTAWSLVGAVDWDSLLTREAGSYEPGVFDARATPPRPTALARAWADLARTGSFDHPVLDGEGWWHRPDRLHVPARTLAARKSPMPKPPRRKPATSELAAAARGRRLLVTGATGTLGRAFGRLAAARGLDVVLTSRADLDLANPASVEAALVRLRPWAVINAAGFVRVADAEREREACFRENAEGPAILAAALARRGLPFATFSSDLVFDGSRGRPYLEDDAPSPTGVYGASKAEAERRVAAEHPGALILRTSAFFGPWDPHNFVHAALREIAAGRPFRAGSAIVSPTYVPDLVHATLDLLIDGEAGLWHLANSGETSWADLARGAATLAGLDAGLVQETGEGRGLSTALGSRRGLPLPALDGALARNLAALEVPWREEVRREEVRREDAARVEEAPVPPPRRPAALTPAPARAARRGSR